MLFVYLVKYFFLYIQLQIVEKQFEEKNFVLKYSSITFNANGRISVVFDPDTIDGWKRCHNGFYTDEVYLLCSAYYYNV